jgi:hypothetical protein
VQCSGGAASGENLRDQVWGSGVWGLNGISRAARHLGGACDRVWGVGFGIPGLGCRVQGLEFGGWEVNVYPAGHAEDVRALERTCVSTNTSSALSQVPGLVDGGPRVRGSPKACTPGRALGRERAPPPHTVGHRGGCDQVTFSAEDVFVETSAW